MAHYNHPFNINSRDVRYYQYTGILQYSPDIIRIGTMFGPYRYFSKHFLTLLIDISKKGTVKRYCLICFQHAMMGVFNSEKVWQGFMPMNL